jgi:hypothetical protein
MPKKHRAIASAATLDLIFEIRDVRQERRIGLSIAAIGNQHYSSMYHLPASAGGLATLGVVLDGRNTDAVAACLVKTTQAFAFMCWCSLAADCHSGNSWAKKRSSFQS